ncbi:glycosyltransferase [Streptomyces sp. NBC_00154]|uniref:glycosyltransferase n=1 Tax=Streptomyces sp. NBC_00154 TaxID=2975670 RepID=UPI00225AC474|nr:glycosyltransferase [Streptomyces sp. NBC_00154]MCX5315199.1 glycosyltransferase [Streptomyces sp. NBC_00154]
MIHQTWKDTDVPLEWQKWADSWRIHHPGWGYRLWTDADNRAFLQEHYPWFLPVYDGYPEAIMRADAIRYFLLDHFGGLYVDLDFECLKPVTEILDGHDLVLGCEPDAHTRLLLARRRGFDRIVGNAFIASQPGHPFWAHVHRRLVATHKLPSTLDVTGPFFLTRAIDSAPEPESITVLDPEVLYPEVSPYATELFGPQEADYDRAYAVHHWSDSWAYNTSGTPRISAGKRFPFWASQELQPVADGLISLDAQRRRWAAGAPAPTVSCLMVTKDRSATARRAIRCFLTQTYPNLELVVVEDATDDALAQHIRDLSDPRIRHHRLPPEERTLGELRNEAVDRATGPYVCQWDDDDLYDPERVETQMAAILALGAEACFLARERLWWPARRKLAVSCARVWEGSMVCAKDRLPRYPAQRRGEDTPVAEGVVRTCRVVSIDAPELYTYVCHGNNTFNESHFAEHFAVATEIWAEPGVYAERLLTMATRLPIEPGEIAHAETGPADRTSERPQAVVEPAVAPASERPLVLVLTPLKDAAAFLPGYLDSLRSLDYPREAISLGLLEGDSKDTTPELLQQVLPGLEAEYRRVTLVRRDFGLQLAGPRWEPGIQRRRRSVLAKVRNHLLSRALLDEEWVLWLDVDVTGYPADLVQRLLGARKGIVVPHCATAPGGPTYDLNTFALQPRAGTLNWSQWLRDGILQPPKGFGRRYLDELRGQGLVRVDSVGGTALLVRADLHRDGLIFPSFPYQHLIETEGLAAMARDMGTACWALPDLEVVHPHHVPEPAHAGATSLS